jgi:hypothetical protein
MDKKVIIFIISFIVLSIVLGLIISKFIKYKNERCSGFSCLEFYTYDLTTDTVFDKRVPTSKLIVSPGFNAVLIVNTSNVKTLQGIQITINSSKPILILIQNIPQTVSKKSYVTLNVGPKQSFLINMQQLQNYESISIDSVNWN